MAKCNDVSDIILHNHFPELFRRMFLRSLSGYNQPEWLFYVFNKWISLLENRLNETTIYVIFLLHILQYFFGWYSLCCIITFLQYHSILNPWRNIAVNIVSLEAVDSHLHPLGPNLPREHLVNQAELILYLLGR